MTSLFLGPGLVHTPSSAPEPGGQATELRMLLGTWEGPVGMAPGHHCRDSS